MRLLISVVLFLLFNASQAQTEVNPFFTSDATGVNTQPQAVTGTSCKAIYDAGHTTNGVYNIVLNGTTMTCYCDMDGTYTPSGGGYTLVLYGQGWAEEATVDYGGNFGHNSTFWDANYTTTTETYIFDDAIWDSDDAQIILEYMDFEFIFLESSRGDTYDWEYKTTGVQSTWIEKKTASSSWTYVSGTPNTGISWDRADTDGYTKGDWELANNQVGSSSYGDYQVAGIGGTYYSTTSSYGTRYNSYNCGDATYWCNNNDGTWTATVTGHKHRYAYSYSGDRLWFK